MLKTLNCYNMLIRAYISTGKYLLTLEFLCTFEFLKNDFFSPS